MHLTSRPSGILVAIFALALPFKAGGCGRTACFTVTAAQLDHGACPSQDVASGRLVNAGCNGNIVSVDGAGALDGNLCCYPVTEQDPGFNGPTPPCGFGGDVPATTGTFPGTTGMGGFGGTGGTTTTPCVSCAMALQGAPFGQVCNPTDLSDLRVCACASKCTSACDPTVCFGNAPDNVCLTCMETACASQLAVCKQN